jgi:hypothetical protein
VAVQRLALVPAECDEVRRGEDQIILADLNAEIALHVFSSAVPTTLKYNDEYRGARQIGRGSGVAAVSRITQL